MSLRYCKRLCQINSMKEVCNNDVYNLPVNDEELNTHERPENTDGNKAEQKIAANPNPRANENIKDRTSLTKESDAASQAGSEITDGEDG